MPETRLTRATTVNRPLDDDAKKRAVVDSIRKSREDFHRAIAGRDGEINLPQFRRLDGDMGATDARQINAHLSRARPRPRQRPRYRPRATWADWLAWALLVGAALYVLAQLPAAFAQARFVAESPVQW